jgi:predicted  nucleic acid-binding Zn-ribbon protein
MMSVSSFSVYSKNKYLKTGSHKMFSMEDQSNHSGDRGDQASAIPPLHDNLDVQQMEGAGDGNVTLTTACEEMSKRVTLAQESYIKGLITERELDQLFRWLSAGQSLLRMKEDAIFSINQPLNKIQSDLNELHMALTDLREKLSQLSNNQDVEKHVSAVEAFVHRLADMQDAVNQYRAALERA